MHRAIPITITAAGCLIGAIAGHQLGRSSVAAVEPHPAPAVAAKKSPAPAAMEAPASRAPGQIIDDFLAALEDRDKTRADAACASIASLDHDGLDLALVAALEIGVRDQRRRVISELIQEMAKRDPDAAIAFLADDLPERERFAYAAPAWFGIIDASDAKTALALYHKHQDKLDGQLGISSLFPIFTRLGAEDIDAAIAATETIEGAGHRHQMISSICESSTDPAKREKLLAWAATLTDEADQRHAYGDLIEIWARRESPEVALAWVEDKALSPAAITSIEQNVSTIQMSQDPQAAAEWLLARASNDNRSDHLAFIVGRWASAAPNAAGEWLGKQTLDASADKALFNFARTITGDDPESAHAWASRITDAELRARATKDVMRQWRRLDPQAAAAAGSVEDR